MERAQEIHGHNHAVVHSDTMARRVAVLISILAAVLAMAEVGARTSQNAYLTHHIAVSDDWAFYQAKNVRSVMRETEAALLASLPNANDPAVQTRIKQARAYAARMRDDPNGNGMKQLAEQARREERARAVAFHRFHTFEVIVGALELAIVLASVSVVTRISALAIGGGVLGVVASIAALGVVAHLW